MSQINIYSGFLEPIQNTILDAVLNATSPNSKIGWIDTRHQLAPKQLKTKAFKPLNCIKANLIVDPQHLQVLFAPVPKIT
jgi:hypothetical protein